MLPTKLETLDDLLAQAEHYANYSMRNIGYLPPTLFLIGADGPLIFTPSGMSGDAEKDDFASNAQLLCIAYAATSLVLAIEAWARFAKPDEKLDVTEAPSEAFDREEIVSLMGESRSGLKQIVLPIIRSGNGKFFGFGDPRVQALDSAQGRFANLLPEKLPDASTRDLARMMLQTKGIKIGGQGGVIPLNKPRRF